MQGGLQANLDDQLDDDLFIGLLAGALDCDIGDMPMSVETRRKRRNAMTGPDVRTQDKNGRMV